jgi:hypothetical protein
MAGSIKSVSVVFQAFTDKFEKKVDKAGKSMGGFAKKAIGFAAGFVAARGSVNKMAESFERLNQLGKLSDSLDVSPDFLRGLDVAAVEVGESFEKAQDVLREFNVRMGEAKTGAGPAVNGLELIGKTIEDFEGLTTEESFLQIADAISKITDEQKKLFAAGEFFGGTGEDMLAMINMGMDGLIERIQRAKELGGPITRKDIEQAEKANNAIRKMENAWSAIFQQLAIGISPMIEDLAEGLTKIVNIGETISKFWKDTELSIGAALIDLKEFTGELSAIQAEDARVMLYRDIFESDRGKKTGSTTGKTKDLPQALQPMRGFAESASYQSSRAFDLLNPNKPNSVAGKNAAANEQTQKNTAKIVTLFSVDSPIHTIPGG